MNKRSTTASAVKSPADRVREIAASVAARTPAVQAKPVVEGPIQLPIWEEDLRGFPNGMARTSLFTASRTDGDDSREFFREPRELASLANYRVTYQGTELRQDDASVFMTLLHIGRSIPLGQPIRFTAYSMLQELGWSLNKKEYIHLRQCCERLQFTSLKLIPNDGSGGYTGSLISEFAYKDAAGEKLQHWVVTLTKNMMGLFQPDTYTLYDWKVRRNIGGRAPLAQWLHYFIGTHGKPIPMKVAKYAELSGSRSKDLRDFRRRLKLALMKLQEVGFIDRFDIVQDYVHIARAAGNKFPAPVPGVPGTPSRVVDAVPA
ncbi:hypothetical protein F6X40_17145 [Paraburkholderia sp. UCT31]|uniref:plasmid replication initiator TrfA n=1 Tax=Paraburkholderia sp. UCT31 TaxID=2615209 RepID=UPI0016564E81|nr:plasmid replication initiator TrfA [Paraburkholderia sp. UCT31]MBC8738502.1 hypothetical protein [Paraburkholderia sp. UCT31]